MAKRLKYKIVDSKGDIVHFSFNKRNAEKWVRNYDGRKNIGIRRIRSKDELRAIHAKSRRRRR